MGTVGTVGTFIQILFICKGLSSTARFPFLSEGVGTGGNRRGPAPPGEKGHGLPRPSPKPRASGAPYRLNGGLDNWGEPGSRPHDGLDHLTERNRLALAVPLDIVFELAGPPVGTVGGDDD